MYLLTGKLIEIEQKSLQLGQSSDFLRDLSCAKPQHEAVESIELVQKHRFQARLSNTTCVHNFACFRNGRLLSYSLENDKLGFRPASDLQLSSVAARTND